MNKMATKPFIRFYLIVIFILSYGHIESKMLLIEKGILDQELITNQLVQIQDSKKQSALGKKLQKGTQWVKQHVIPGLPWIIIGGVAACQIIFPHHIPFHVKYRLKVDGKLTDEKLRKTIRDICHEMNFSNPEDIALYASKSDGMPAATYSKAIILNSEALGEFTPEEQRFIIGHEGAHIKNNHCIKQTLATLAISVSLNKLVDTYRRIIDKIAEKLAQKFSLKKYPHCRRLISSLKKQHDSVVYNPILKEIITLLLFFHYCKQLEKEADMVAATLLDNADVGAKVFAGILQKHGENWRDVCHPPLAQRTRYLSELAKQQRARAAA